MAATTTSRSAKATVTLALCAWFERGVHYEERWRPTRLRGRCVPPGVRHGAFAPSWKWDCFGQNATFSVPRSVSLPFANRDRRFAPCRAPRRILDFICEHFVQGSAQCATLRYLLNTTNISQFSHLRRLPLPHPLSSSMPPQASFPSLAFLAPLASSALFSSPLTLT